jgi:hypothetical protein
LQNVTKTVISSFRPRIKCGINSSRDLEVSRTFWIPDPSSRTRSGTGMTEKWVLQSAQDTIGLFLLIIYLRNVGPIKNILTKISY